MAYIYDLTDTWNAGGTTFNGIKLNVTDSGSAVSSKLVTLQTNGTEHFSVTKAGVGYFSGNVGIGTSSPTKKLSIETTPSAPTNGFNIQYSGSEVASFTANASSGEIRIGATGTGTYVPTFYSNNAERMRIDSSGNVGIGTSSPTAQLHLAGPAEIKMTNTTNTSGYDIGLLGGSSDANAYVYQRANAALIFGTNNNDRVRITAAGDVGIGTSSPSSGLDVNGFVWCGTKTAVSGAGGNVRYRDDTGTFRYAAGILGTAGATAFSIYDNIAATERMVISSTGNVGIGTSSPTSYTKLTVAGGLQVSGAIGSTAATGGGVISNEFPVTRAYIGDGSGFSWAFSSRSGSVTTDRVTIQDTGNVGIGTSSPIAKLDVDGSINARSGTVQADLFQNWGSNLTLNSGGGLPILFQTNGTERMRIDSSGNLLVGTTSAISGGRVSIDSGSGPSIGSKVNGTGAIGHILFENPNGVVGQIFTNGSTTTFATSSDVRLKHEIIDAPEASSLIDAIQVRSFKWNADNSEQRYGFIAQELVTVAPEAVSQPADPDDMMGVDYSKLVPMLVKELQSVRARLAQLEGAA